MAHTKTSTHKNPSSPTPSSSLSPSPYRSPSPPPRPTPQYSSLERTFSDYMSSSPESSPRLITLEPLATILPPLYQCDIPSISQAPPHLRKTLNPSSSTSSSTRRSMRVLTGIGFSKTKNIDTTINSIFYDDCEPSPPPQNPKAQNFSTSQSSKPKSPEISKFPKISKPPATSKSSKSPSNGLSSKTNSSKTKSTFPKSPSSSTLSQFLASKKLKNPTKFTKKTSTQECSSSKLPTQERSPLETQECSPFKTPNPKSTKTSQTATTKPSTKPSSSKILIPPLIPSKFQTLFAEKWAQRPIGIGRVFSFENLQVEGISIQHHTDALG
uniref:Endochitinase A-like n=1 Tax=Cicer arietinum TaxID=3827 RepID=A0A1S2XFM9_CICAR|nr:endochitinase A-like [Cicer arietinum]